MPTLTEIYAALIARPGPRAPDTPTLLQDLVNARPNRTIQYSFLQPESYFNDTRQAAINLRRNIVSELSPDEKDAIKAVLGLWSAVANIKFEETAERLLLDSGRDLVFYNGKHPGESNLSALDLWEIIFDPTVDYRPGEKGFFQLLQKTGALFGLKYPKEFLIDLENGKFLETDEARSTYYLRFKKSGNDLILETGQSDKLTLKSWYQGNNNKSIKTLQVITEAMSDYDPSSTDNLKNKKINLFDMTQLVSAFDQARTATPGITSWALTNKLLDAHLAATDSAALGGDLAYQYGTTGSLAGIGFNAALGVMSATNFGSQAQALQALPTLQTGVVRLG